MHGVPIEEVPYGPSSGNKKTDHAAPTSHEVLGARRVNAEDAEYLQTLATRKQAWAVDSAMSNTDSLQVQNIDQPPTTERRKRIDQKQVEGTHLQRPQQQQQRRRPKTKSRRNSGKEKTDGVVNEVGSVSMAERYAAAEAAVAEAEAAQQKAADHERTLRAKEARLAKMKVRYCLDCQTLPHQLSVAPSCFSSCNGLCILCMLHVC